MRLLLLLPVFCSVIHAFSNPAVISIGRRPAIPRQSRPALQAGITMADAPTATVSVKPPPGAYAQAVTLGTAKGELSTSKTLVLGALAGAYIGFGTLLMMAVGCSCPALKAANIGLQRIIQGAFGLPLGLMLVLVMGGELFTGNTALVTAAACEGKVSVKQVAKNWSLAYVGNFIGSLFVAYLAFSSGMFGAGANTVAVATAKTSLTWTQAFTRGILCNWLVCMATWMASAASDMTGKVVAIWFPISAFIAMGFEHSVANMCLIPLGMMHGAVISTKSFLLSNLLPVTLGNTFAGVFLVAIAYKLAYGSK